MVLLSWINVENIQGFAYRKPLQIQRLQGCVGSFHLSEFTGLQLFIQKSRQFSKLLGTKPVRLKHFFNQTEQIPWGDVLELLSIILIKAYFSSVLDENSFFLV